MDEENVTQEQVEEKGYPLPGSKDKPLKIDGTELEAIILIPKGVKTEYPMPKEAKDSEAKPESKPEPSPDEEKIKALTSEAEELRKKVEELTMSLKEHLVEDIMEIKDKKQLSQEGDKEKYLQLDIDALKVLLTELKEIKEPSRAEPKAKFEKQELSDVEAKKAEIRKRLFGYESEGE